MGNATLAMTVALVFPATVYAQGMPASGTGTLEGITSEIRLLRQALERQSAAGTRVQLLIGRLTLQDQRTARARAAVERLESELASGERERDELQAASREMVRSLEQATDHERRTELETQSRMIRDRYTKAVAQLARTEGRVAQARQALDIEAGSYDEFDRLLADLDRQLQTGR